MKYTCKQCSVVFTARPSKKRQYCSKLCVTISLTDQNRYGPCEACGINFWGHTASQRFCSKKCSGPNQINPIRDLGLRPMLGRHHTEESKLKTSQKLLGRVFSPETIKKMSKGHKGQTAWNKGKGIYLNLQRSIRGSDKYRKWRKQIFERDDYTCQKCEKRGCQIHADHINPFSVILRDLVSVFPDKDNDFLYQKSILFAPLWDLENGRTLCVGCHRKTDSYGGKILPLKPLIDLKQYSHG